MILTGDWVIPVSAPPVRDGAVRMLNNRIESVGRASDFTAQYPDEDRRDFPGCVLMPGLVNAHTHLALTALEGLIPPMQFEDWLPKVVAGMSAWTADDFAASAMLGVHRCLEAGVTCVGDIVYGPESVAAASDGGIGGAFFWEVLGISADELPAKLESLEFPDDGHACSGRVHCGLSPHSLYTAGPDLLRAAHRFSAINGLPFAMHVAESAAEVELTQSGKGRLADVAARLAPGFRRSSSNPVAYLDGLGVLDNTTAIHLCQTLPTDVPRLAATIRGAVTCPRSNSWLSTGTAPVERLLHAHVAVGIGTDSSASNSDLDLMSDVRELKADSQRLKPRQLVEIATVLGAQALGVEDDFGTLAPGKQADVAIFQLPGAVDDPEKAVVETAGRETLVALLSASAWRYLDGALVESKVVGQDVAAAKRRAETAITSLPRNVRGNERGAP